MCVIIDASLAARIFASPMQEDFVPLWNWVRCRDGCIVYGGQLAAELERVRQGARQLKHLSAAGKAYRVPSESVVAETRAVRNLGICVSDDPHVIALARASKARVLCSGDRNLHADFKNLRLLPAPKGRIYQNAEHASVLRHDPGCIGRRRN